MLQDQALLERLTTGSAWNEFAIAWQLAEPQLVAPTLPVSEINRLVLAVLTALLRLEPNMAAIAETLTSDTKDALFDDWNRVGWADLRARLSGAVPSQFVELIKQEYQSGRVRSVVILSPSGSSFFDLPEDAVHSANRALVGSVNRAAIAHAHMLICVDPIAQAAATRLRVLASEVFDGAAILTRGSEEMFASGKFSLDMREIPTTHIGALAQAIREARELLGLSSTQRIDNAAVADAPLETEVGASSNVGSGAKLDEEATTGESNEDALRDPVADFVGLVDHVTAMPDSMEIEWSDALREVLTDSSIAESLARYGSLLSSHLAAIQSNDTLEEWPLPENKIRELSPSSEATPEHEITAHLYVVRQLGDSLRALREPTLFGKLSDSSNGRLFWESGGFARSRSLANLLLRSLENIGQVADQAGRSEEHFVGVEGRLRRDPTQVYFQDALLASSAGLPEAALLYLNLSLASMSEGNSSSVANRDLLSEALGILATGATIPLSRVIPLADLLLRDVASAMSQGSDVA